MSTQNQNNKPAQMSENKFEVILGRIIDMEEKGLKMPLNYSPENALRSAWLILQETETRSKKPVLEACSSQSIANAVLKMAVLGLNPIKNQCSFIAYGNKLEMQREYQGAIAIARRHGLEDIPANVIHEDDVFEYEIDSNGKTKITKHEQPFENLSKEIIGAYAIANMSDGSQDATIMTMADIRKSWEQGSTNGKSPAHKNFPGEMCKKTVIGRACKTIINSSDDGDLFSEEKRESQTEAFVDHEIETKANKKQIDFDEAEEAEDKPQRELPEKQKSEKAPERKPEPQAEKQPAGQTAMPDF